MPNLPYQLGKTFRIPGEPTQPMIENISVHTRTIFSQRMSVQTREVLKECMKRALAALDYCIGRATELAPMLRDGDEHLGPYNIFGQPTETTFSNELSTYFRVGAQDAGVVADLMDTLRQGYVSIARGLRGPLDIVDLPIMMQGSRTCGYVKNYMVGGRVGHIGAIHINFGNISRPNIDQVANTLIHEAAHKFITAKDHAYDWEVAKWANLTRQQAMDNADSISGFAMKALKDGAKWVSVEEFRWMPLGTGD